MKDWTWPMVAAFFTIVAAVVALFALSNDLETRKHLIGYMDNIVVFVVGAAAGAAAGAGTAYYRGYKLGKGP